MGNYNPRAPLVLGNEWVNIRESPYSLDVETERGYSFTLTGTTTVVSGCAYVDELPASSSMKAITIAVYQAGREDLTGPLQQVLIPPISGVAGPTSSTGGSFSIFPSGSTIAQVLSSPNDVSFLELGGNDTSVWVFFDVNSYSSLLSGKRIHSVRVLYTIVSPDGINPPKTHSQSIITPGLVQTGVGNADPVVAATSLYTVTTPQVIDLGNLMPFNPLVAGDTPGYTNSSSYYPWRLEDLQRFVNSSANALAFNMNFFNDTDSVADNQTPQINITYVALEVTYCEETRVLYGAKGGLGISGGKLPPFAITAGQNVIQLRPSDTFAVTGKALPAGQYTVTVTQGKFGVFFDARGDVYDTRAQRQLYALPSHPGVEVTTRAAVGDTYTQRSTDVLPQITLHTASAVVTGVHTYGTQVGARVYGVVPATQEIVQLAGASGVSYPQVRFYARRFGDTEDSLSLFRTSTPTQVVTITPAALDALDEIVDGWREVTLRFSVVPTFDNSGTTSQWTFQSSNTTINSQWQVLGAYSLGAASGTFNTDGATYGSATARLVSAVTTSPPNGADAVLMFSQDPPAVTGLAVVEETQALTVGTECTLTPDCTPTGLTRHHLTWQPISTTTVPVTGFGYYELQRSDDVDATWNTIMKTSSQFVTGFYDYEARVGVSSSYRIRSANVLDFRGAWSSTVSHTLTSPGVSGIGDGNSVLLFTTNELQDGSGNLAYVMAWERNVSEDFTFPEAGDVQLQQLYRRDFVTAFRPTERGGERFTRDVLVQNCAVSTGRMRDGFTSLRDMAWNEVSYVCVRNELGDRWFATVLVPSGSVTRNRRLYIAQVGVVEVTATPSQVEPAG